LSIWAEDLFDYICTSRQWSSAIHDEATIEAIYEAAFDPDRWTDVLDQIIARSQSASGAIILFSDHHYPRGVASQNVSVFFDHFLQSDEWRTSYRIKRMLELKPSGFVDIDVFLGESGNLDDPVWANLQSLGRESQLCTIIPMPSGETVAFTTERDARSKRYDAEAIAAMNGLRPHLARAGLVSARLGLERAQETVATLDRLGLAAAVVTDKRQVQAANARLDALSQALVPLAFDRIAIAEPNANRLFLDAFDHLRIDDWRGVQSIPVPATESCEALIVHLVPLRGAALDLFSGSQILVVVSTVDAPSGTDLTLLRALFDLTPAEAALIERLMQGATIGEIAAQKGLSVATLRTQLSSVFGKTGTSRQAELVRLVSGVWMPPG